MKIIKKSAAIVSGLVFILLMFSSCATVPELRVTYRLPPKTDDPNNKEIVLIFEDNRNDKNMIGQGAKDEFEGFPGNLYLSLAKDQDKGFMIGLFKIETLFMKAFEERLNNMGLIPRMEKRKGRDELVIVLNEFLLDLVGNKWIARISYHALVQRNGVILTKQVISGDAERHKIIGRSQADVIMSEIFTDVINQLDIVKLLNQAGGYSL